MTVTGECRAPGACLPGVQAQEPIAALIPHLRRYARALAPTGAAPDELVRATLERAAEALRLAHVEADLQAYVDGRLDAARAAVLEAWLAAHRGDGVRVAAYRQLGREWREAYASVLVEPVPRELLATLQTKAKAPGPRSLPAAVAA